MPQERVRDISETTTIGAELSRLPGEASLTLRGIAEAEVQLGRLSKEAAVREGVSFARDETLGRGESRARREEIGAFYDSITS